MGILSFNINIICVYILSNIGRWFNSTSGIQCSNLSAGSFAFYIRSLLFFGGEQEFSFRLKYATLDLCSVFWTSVSHYGRFLQFILLVNEVFPMLYISSISGTFNFINSISSRTRNIFMPSVSYSWRLRRVWWFLSLASMFRLGCEGLFGVNVCNNSYL